ncbi:MAG: DUF6364 family protein [Propionibacteriaceae bacterium]|jgi:hypothetical protein|nr:DUF6364 family protein [Propionibacteriaceae bacterium]
MTRNITLTMPDEVVRQAKVVAAQRDISVSALVTELLTAVTGETQDYDHAWEREAQLMQQGIGMRMGDITWTREDTHAR